MTIVSAIATATLGWTGAETVWSPGFQAQNTTDVSLVYTPTGGAAVALALGTHYTAALDGNDNYTAYPAAGAMPAPSGLVAFTRNSTFLQSASFQDGVPFSSKVFGQALDLTALRDQELAAAIAAVNLALSADSVTLASLQAQVTALQAAVAGLLSYAGGGSGSFAAAATAWLAALPVYSGVGAAPVASGLPFWWNNQLMKAG